MGNWSDENPAIWLVDNELTVAGGIYVQALDDIELIDFVDINIDKKEKINHNFSWVFIEDF